MDLVGRHIERDVFADQRLVIGLAVRQIIGGDGLARAGNIVVAQEGEQGLVCRDDAFTDRLGAKFFQFGLLVGWNAGRHVEERAIEDGLFRRLVFEGDRY